MHKYYVESTELVTRSTLLVTLQHEKDAAPTFAFSPGQYAAISFVRKHRPSVARCFSIVSSPTRTTELQFAMRVRGRYTTAFAKLQVGDEVDVRGPYGGFVFDPSRHSDSVFVAGGIGITPFMSMIEFVAVTQCERQITLLYGVQTQDDVPFLEALRAYKARAPHLTIVLAVGAGPVDKLSDFSTVQGRITPELLLSTLGKTEKTAFICGPPPFMRGMVQTLKGAGVPQERIITEAFNQGSHRQTGKVLSWPRNMYVMGALGIGFGSLAVMVSDIIKTLPAVPLTENDRAESPLHSTGQRETDLDTLINGLSAQPSTEPESPALTAAQTEANQAPPQTATAPTTAVTPTPVVTQPKCTTSQSGVTTCI